MVSISLAGIVFPGGEGWSGGWFAQSLSDWFSLSDAKSDEVERPQAHGAFDPGTDWRSGAVRTLTVGFIGNYADLETALRDLNGRCAAPDGLVQLVVDSGASVTHADVSVRHIDPPNVRAGARRVEGIQIDMFCPDPRIFGIDVTASTGLPIPGTGVVFPFAFPAVFGEPGNPGRVQFTNAGTAPTALRFRVAGGMSQGFSLKCIESSDVLTMLRPIPDGSFVTLDASDGSVLLDGVSPISGFLIEDDWWQVNPGETCTIQFEALGEVTGSPQLQVTGAPAWF